MTLSQVVDSCIRDYFRAESKSEKHFGRESNHGTFRDLPHHPPVLPPDDFRRVHSCPEKSGLNVNGIRFRFTQKCSTTRKSIEVERLSVSMGQGLGLAPISEARASACVSIYSRMFVSLPTMMPSSTIAA